MSKQPLPSDETQSQGDAAGEGAFRNDLLAIWLDDVEAGRPRSVAEYQEMFPGHEVAVAAELQALSSETEMVSVATDPNAPHIPDVELIEKIGRGGQGVVYRGLQSYLDREVAVKILAPANWSTSFASRFRREAATLASLRHPNIVTCYQAGTTDSGLAYMVMEFIDGPNLREWLRDNGPMPQELALRVCRDLALALDHAQQSGIIHRDVKPENVLLQPLATRQGEPEGDQVPFAAKLADLGLARVVAELIGDQAMTQLTPVGMVMGSPLTMAPEQFDDPNGVDHRADIYGLGCVLFHAIAGESAFQARNITAAIKEKIDPNVPDLRKVAPDVRRDVAEFVCSMLAPAAEDRPGSHAEVAAICDRLTGDAGRAPRARLWMALAVLFVAGVAFVLADPLGIVYAPSVVIATTENVIEGQTVTLSAKAAGSGELAYAWSQTSGASVRLSAADQRAVSFLAPRGLGTTTLSFEVAVSNRWRTRVELVRVAIQADPALAELGPEQALPLLDPRPGKTLDGWRVTSKLDAWGTAEDDVSAAAWCRKGVATRRSRYLPRGKWVLTGSVIPRERQLPNVDPKSLAEAGLRLEFGCGNVVVLALRSNNQGQGYVAELRHDRESENTVETLATLATSRPPLSSEKHLQFTLAWDGSTLTAAWGTKPGDANWTKATADPSRWPTDYPPGALTIYVDDGHAWFRGLHLQGR